MFLRYFPFLHHKSIHYILLKNVRHINRIILPEKFFNLFLFFILQHAFFLQTKDFVCMTYIHALLKLSNWNLFFNYLSHMIPLREIILSLSNFLLCRLTLLFSMLETHLDSDFKQSYTVILCSVIQNTNLTLAFAF